MNRLSLMNRLRTSRPRLSRATIVASACAAGLFVFAARSAQASSITTTTDGPTLYAAGTDVSHTFQFGSGAYSLTLEFDDLTTSTNISVTASTFAFGQTTTANGNPLPAGQECLPIVDASTCVEFSITADTDLDSDFTGNANVLIQWTYDTEDNGFPDDPNTQGDGNVVLIHYHDGEAVDITVPGSYFSSDTPPTPDQCGPNGVLRKLLTPEQFDQVCQDDFDFRLGFWIYDFFRHEWIWIPFDFGRGFGPGFGFGLGSDPGEAGELDVFSSDFDLDYITAVPEPASMLLLGSGLVALVVRRRRR